jgi:hypothetical protein
MKLLLKRRTSYFKQWKVLLQKRRPRYQIKQGTPAEVRELRTGKKHLQTMYEAEATENTRLKQSLKELRDICLDFGNRCIQRLKKVFNSVGASAEKFTPSVEDISSTFEHIEGEVEALDEVIAGHGDFCALLASSGTTVAFLKAGCTHAKNLNRPNFSLSASDLVDIPNIARSIGSRFITQIWAKGWSRTGQRRSPKPIKAGMKLIPVTYLF